MSRWGAPRIWHLAAPPGGHALYVPIDYDFHWGLDSGADEVLLPLSPETLVYTAGEQYWYQSDYSDIPYAWGASSGHYSGPPFVDATGQRWLTGQLLWTANPDPTIPITNTRWNDKEMPWAMRWNATTEQVEPAFWVPGVADGPYSIFGGTRTDYAGGIMSACDNLSGPGIYAVVHSVATQQPIIVYYPGTGITATTAATAGADFLLSTGGMNSAGYPAGSGDVYSYTALHALSLDPVWPFLSATDLPKWAGSPCSLFTHAGAYYCLAGGDFYYPTAVPNFNTYAPSRFNVQALWRATTDPSDPAAWSLVRLLTNYDLNNWYASRSASPAQAFGLDWSFYNDQFDLRWGLVHAGALYLSYAHTTSTYHGYATGYDLANLTGIWRVDGAGAVSESYGMAFAGTLDRVRMMGPLAALDGVLYALEWEMPIAAASTDLLTLRLLRLGGGGWTLINAFTQALATWGTRMWGGFWGQDGYVWMTTDRSQGFGVSYSGVPANPYPPYRIWRCDPTTIGATAAWTLWMNEPMADPWGFGRYAAPIKTQPFAGG